MNSIYERTELQHSEQKCGVCMGLGIVCSPEFSINPEETICKDCHGTGFDLEFGEEMHRKVFYQVLNTFQRAIERHDSGRFTQRDYDNTIGEIASILQLIPAINVHPNIDEGFTMLTLEDHGIIFATEKILAVF